MFGSNEATNMHLLLLPFSEETYSCTTIPLVQQGNLFESIHALQCQVGCDVPQNFHSTMFSAKDFSKILHDGCGNPLQYVCADDLLSVIPITNNTINKAAHAYLHAIDGDTKVALYWWYEKKNNDYKPYISLFTQLKR